MKGRLLKKAAALALAALLVTGGVPIQPLSQVFDRTAITAEAAQEQIVTYTLERESVNGRNIYYLVGTDGTRNMAYDGGKTSPTRITLEMGDDVTVDVYLGGNSIGCGYTENQEVADLVGFTNYFSSSSNLYEFTFTSNTHKITHVQIDGRGKKDYKEAKTSIEADGNEKTITVQWAGGSGGTRNGAPGKFIVTYAPPVSTYNISYKLNGGTNASSNPATYDDDKAVTLANPTRTGYTFGGWYDNASFSGSPVTSIPKGSSGDKTLYAKWTINSYTVTWKNADGSTLKTDTVEYGNTPSYGGTPTKAGNAQYSYTFSGWSPAVSAVTSDTTYTAQFTQTVNKYTVTWKDEDGTVLETDTNVPYGTTPTYDGATPTKEGNSKYTYTFNGWTPTVSAVTGDAEYTATFTITPKSYTVTYKVDGETYGNVDTVAYGTALTAREAPTKTGYTFSGWSEIPAAMPDEDVVITGTFTLNQHTVTYKVDGETYGSIDTVAYGTDLTARDEPEARTGYTFSGWSNIPTTMPDNDVVITGTFTANTYTVHFDPVIPVNGEMADQTFTYDEDAKKLTKNTFHTTTGEWLSWNTKADGTGTTYTDEQLVRNLTDENGGTVTLYAQWHLQKGIFFDQSIFDCVVNGESGRHYYAYPGESVQVFVNDNSSVHTVHVYTITDVNNGNYIYGNEIKNLSQNYF